MSDYDINTRTKIGNIKSQTNIESKWDEVLRKIVGKTKIDRIRNQQIRESCGTEPINERVQRRRRRRRRSEWDEHVTRMDAERLVKITRDMYLPEHLKDVRKEHGAT